MKPIIISRLLVFYAWHTAKPMTNGYCKIRVEKVLARNQAQDRRVEKVAKPKGDEPDNLLN